jgi:hypothetical protein
MLPVQDLFATIKEVGPGDCLEVVELLHPRQVQGFFDLDGWRKDRIDPTTLGEVDRSAFRGEPRSRLDAAARARHRTLVVAREGAHAASTTSRTAKTRPKTTCRVHIVTPDGRYLVVFDVASANEKLIHGLKSALEHLMGRDMQFVLKLLEAVRWEMPSSLEEEAFRWRNGRLADMGFLDPGEAQLVFAWVDPDGPMVGQPVKVPPLPRRADDEGAANLATSVLLPWSLLDGGSGRSRARALRRRHTRKRAHRARAHVDDEPRAPR